jgi:hypothetical protein
MPARDVTKALKANVSHDCFLQRLIYSPLRLSLSSDRPQLSSNIKYIFTNLCGFERIYNHSHCFSGIMKIGFSFLIKTLMGWPDLDIRYLAIDCLDKHLDHPLNGICKLRDSNFTVCQLTG